MNGISDRWNVFNFTLECNRVRLSLFFMQDSKLATNFLYWMDLSSVSWIWCTLRLCSMNSMSSALLSGLVDRWRRPVREIQTSTTVSTPSVLMVRSRTEHSQYGFNSQVTLQASRLATGLDLLVIPVSECWLCWWPFYVMGHIFTYLLFL